MTAVMNLDRDRSNRAEQVEHLRRKIAGMSGKASGAGGSSWRGSASPETVLPDSETLLPIPESLAGQLPGALPRGTVAVLSGARSLVLQMVAAITAAGGHAAIVGQPDVGSAGCRRDGCGSEPACRRPRSRGRSGRGGRRADGRYGSGGAGVGRTVGTADPGAGGNGAGSAEGVHPAGHRRRLAGGVDPTGRPGLRLRGRRRGRWSRPHPGVGGSVGCGWTPGRAGGSPGPVHAVGE